MSKQTTINASARMVHIEIEGDDAFVAKVAGAVSGIISNLVNREAEQPAPGQRKTTKTRASKKAAAGAAAASAPRTVRVTKGGR